MSQPLLRLAAGAVAGVVAMSATYPLDMVRGRLTVQADGRAARYRGLGHAVRSIFREEGARAFYKGWLPSVIGVVPYVGLNFAVYESLKEGVLRSRGLTDERDLGVFTRLCCGAVAGSVGQTVAYPLDVVRRRLQVTGWSASAVVAGAGGAAAVAPASRPVIYTGMVDCFVKTVRYEGVSALFKGLLPNYVKARARRGVLLWVWDSRSRVISFPRPGLPFHCHRVCDVRAAEEAAGRRFQDLRLAAPTRLEFCHSL